MMKRSPDYPIGESYTADDHTGPFSFNDASEGYLSSSDFPVHGLSPEVRSPTTACNSNPPTPSPNKRIDTPAYPSVSDILLKDSSSTSTTNQSSSATTDWSAIVSSIFSPAPTTYDHSTPPAPRIQPLSLPLSSSPPSPLTERSQLLHIRAERHYHTQARRRVVNTLHHAAHTRRRTRLQRVAADAHKRLSFLDRAVGVWVRVADAGHGGIARRNSNKIRLSQAISAWKQYTLRKQYVHDAGERIRGQRLRAVLQRWRNNTDAQLEERANMVIAENHLRDQRLSRVLTRFIHHHEAKTSISNLTRIFHSQQLQRQLHQALQHWSSQSRLRHTANAASSLPRARLVRRSWAVWRAALGSRRERNRKRQTAVEMMNKLFASRCLGEWRQAVGMGMEDDSRVRHGGCEGGHLAAVSNSPRPSSARTTQSPPYAHSPHIFPPSPAPLAPAAPPTQPPAPNSGSTAPSAALTGAGAPSSGAEAGMIAADGMFAADRVARRWWRGQALKRAVWALMANADARRGRGGGGGRLGEAGTGRGGGGGGSDVRMVRMKRALSIWRRFAQGKVDIRAKISIFRFHSMLSVFRTKARSNRGIRLQLQHSQQQFNSYLLHRALLSWKDTAYTLINLRGVAIEHRARTVVRSWREYARYHRSLRTASNKASNTMITRGVSALHAHVLQSRRNVQVALDHLSRRESVRTRRCLLRWRHAAVDAVVSRGGPELDPRVRQWVGKRENTVLGRYMRIWRGVAEVARDRSHREAIGVLWYRSALANKSLHKWADLAVYRARDRLVLEQRGVPAADITPNTYPHDHASYTSTDADIDHDVNAQAEGEADDEAVDAEAHATACAVQRWRDLRLLRAALGRRSGGLRRVFGGWRAAAVGDGGGAGTGGEAGEGRAQHRQYLHDPVDAACAHHPSLPPPPASSSSATTAASSPSPPARASSPALSRLHTPPRSRHRPSSHSPRTRPLASPLARPPRPRSRPPPRHWHLEGQDHRHGDGMRSHAGYEAVDHEAGLVRRRGEALWGYAGDAGSAGAAGAGAAEARAGRLDLASTNTYCAAGAKPQSRARARPQPRPLWAAAAAAHTGSQPQHQPQHQPQPRPQPRPRPRGVGETTVDTNFACDGADASDGADADVAGVAGWEAAVSASDGGVEEVDMHMDAGGVADGDHLVESAAAAASSVNVPAPAQAPAPAPAPAPLARARRPAPRPLPAFAADV